LDPECLQVFTTGSTPYYSSSIPICKGATSTPTRAFGPSSDYFLALTNNYIPGDYTPPEEDAEKIKEYFGLDGPPRWYLDAEGYQRWGYHTLDKRKHS